MFKFLKLRHALTAVFVAPFLISIQGCDDSAAVATVASIGIIGGALTIGSYDGYYYDCYGYYGCGYYDHRGYYYGRHYPRGYYRYYSADQEQKVTEDLNNTASVAAHYGITMEAASVLKNALRATVENQNLQSIYDLGLSSSDLQSIAENREISAAGLQKVSSKLGLTVEQTRAVAKQMMTDAQQSRQ